MTSIPFTRGILVCAISLALAACATNVPPPDPRPLPRNTGALSPALAEAAARANSPTDDRSRIYKGTGVVVKGQEPGGALPNATGVQGVAGGAVVLNFEAAELRDVIRNILGDILNVSYTIDPAVGGQVTIRTSAGIAREALPATLEMLLRMNGATMVREDGIFKIIPQAAAIRGNVSPQLGNSQRALPQGFSVQVIPLRYVGAREMLRILEPFAKDASAIRADDLRNLVILAGTETELRHLMNTVTMFDIDWMSGMSAGVFTLQNSDVKTVVQELDKVLGDRNLSPLTGIIRIIPIERMNALLVISPNPAYVEEAKKWIERLDGSGGGEGARFYVYNLQNQRAERIAPLLQQALTGRVTQPSDSDSAHARARNARGHDRQSAVVHDHAEPARAGARDTPRRRRRRRALALPATASGSPATCRWLPTRTRTRCCWSRRPSEFSLVDQALKKLDVQSRQVMIEVTIAEVTLNDSLTFGVEWLFKGGAPSGRG